MIALLLSAAVAVSQPAPSQDTLGQAAYIAGRCYVHLSDTARAETVSTLDRQPQSQALSRLYYQGIQDSRREPLTRSTCERLIAEMKAELNR